MNAQRTELLGRAAAAHTCIRNGLADTTDERLSLLAEVVWPSDRVRHARWQAVKAHESETRSELEKRSRDRRAAREAA